jgi:hypothetical protein
MAIHTASHDANALLPSTCCASTRTHEGGVN